jgi:hypothetical protein
MADCKCNFSGSTARAANCDTMTLPMTGKFNWREVRVGMMDKPIMTNWVYFHISSSSVRIRLHIKNQVSRLHESGLKCNHIRGLAVWWWWCGVVVFLPIKIPHQPSCFVLFGLVWCCWLGCGNCLLVRYMRI